MCKNVLGLQVSAPASAALTELGEIFTEYELKLAPIRLWLRVLKGREDSLCAVGLQESRSRGG